MERNNRKLLGYTEELKALQDFLPFKSISNDQEHNRKVLALALYELLPRVVDIDEIANLFNKHFSTKLDGIDDNITEYPSPLCYLCLKSIFAH